MLGSAAGAGATVGSSGWAVRDRSVFRRAVAAFFATVLGRASLAAGLGCSIVGSLTWATGTARTTGTACVSLTTAAAGGDVRHLVCVREPGGALQAVAPLERLQRWEDAKTAYTAALTRWPNSITARMGLGNSLYALHDVRGAETAYRHVTQQDPDFAPAYNNLAQTLADQNHLDAAEQAARHAVNLGGPLLTTYQDTLRQIIAQKKPAP